MRRVLKHRLDAETLMRAVDGSIARKAREGVMNKRAQLTMNSIGDGILSTDNSGLITFLNPIAERLIGWTYAEAAGRHLMEVFQVVESPVEEHASLLYDRSNHISGMVVVLHAVTESRATAHKSLHPAEHDVLDHLPISLGEQRWRWRFPSPAPRALS
jgi:PAS domain-containing protein